MTRVVAIHQPNFFPWLGYFDKIVRSDVFVLLDDVQFQKTGGMWCNRVKLLVANEARWVTAAVDRSYHGTRTIREMSFLHSIPWRSKLLKSLEANYGRHPYYGECMSVIEPLVENSEANVAAFNTRAIFTICDALGIDHKKLRTSSTLTHTGSSNNLLCSITHAVGGQIYMYGGGADGYQDETIFAKAGIGLVPQGFVHPTYTQFKSQFFQPGLSVIDAVMNLGWSGAARLVYL